MQDHSQRNDYTKDLVAVKKDIGSACLQIPQDECDVRLARSSKSSDFSHAKSRKHKKPSLRNALFRAVVYPASLETQIKTAAPAMSRYRAKGTNPRCRTHAMNQATEP
jgi:cytochrome c peroxidase